MAEILELRQTDGIKTGAETGLAKVAIQCSADRFVVNQSSFLHINICAKIPTFAKPENVTNKPTRPATQQLTGRKKN
jgi:hypothetical protein